MTILNKEIDKKVFNSNFEKEEETELMSHPGFYKTCEIETILFSPSLGRRRHSFSGIKKKKEETDFQYFYISEDDN